MQSAYVTHTSKGIHSSAGFPSLKVGEIEEDKLARPKGQKGEENLIRISLPVAEAVCYREFGRSQTGLLVESQA